MNNEEKILELLGQVIARQNKAQMSIRRHEKEYHEAV